MMINLQQAKQCAAKLLSEIGQAQTICLTTHQNPDGDGLCSCLALQKILQYLGYKVEIVVDDLSLDRYGFLQVYDHVLPYNESQVYELVFIIDLHDETRLGSRIDLVRKARKVFVIDHHEVQDDLVKCDCCWIEPKAVSTGWMLHEMFRDTVRSLPAEDRKYVGDCLYTTLLNDTNNFINANTDRHAFELAAETYDYGVNPSELYRLYLTSRTPLEMRLLGQVLSTIELHDEGNILFVDSSLEMLEMNGLDKEATSNLTRWVQDLKGVDSVIFFREESIGIYRLSLRSKVYNVHNIAVKYGGGGHIQASGCSMKGTLPEIKQTVLLQLRQADRLVK
jgi:bifunctional oligoribonuclease and PAP phosphatase NrnA